MAEDSLQRHAYSSKSDVWPFDVLLWEITALGARLLARNSGCHMKPWRKARFTPACNMPWDTLHLNDASGKKSKAID